MVQLVKHHFSLKSTTMSRNQLCQLTCSVQFTLFFRNSTNLSTTPGVFITSSMGGLGSEMGRHLIEASGRDLALWLIETAYRTFGKQFPELLRCGELELWVL